jgi:hypothetical protein
MLMRGRRRRRSGRPGGKAAAAVEPGGWGGRGGGRCEDYGDQEPQRPGQVGEEAALVLGADGERPTAWRGARASAGRWTADFRKPAATENPVVQRTGDTAECSGRGG